MIRFLYLLYIWILAAPVFLVTTILTAIIVMAGCMTGSGKIFRFFAYYPGMWWSKFTCALALCPVKVRGKQHLTHKQSYVFVANHQGAFDIFLIYGFLGVPIKWMMKIGLAKLPFVGAACSAAGFIFVDQSSPRAALKSIKEAEKQLQHGASLVVFPEGSRTTTGKMGKFHKGAFQVAKDQHLTIVPITLNGPFKVLPIGAVNPHPHRMEMIIHPPIELDSLVLSEKNGLQALADQTRTVIASALWKEFL
jgi:1-acyl-sn-glycerol-3-phosphate acyltransferase